MTEASKFVVFFMLGCLGVVVCQEGGVRCAFMVIRRVFSYQGLSDTYVWVGAIHGFGLCVKREQRCLSRYTNPSLFNSHANRVEGNTHHE